MRFTALFAGVIAAVPLPAQLPATLTLMPVPASLTVTDARLRIDSTLTVGITGYRDARLERGITRAVARLEGRLGTPLTRTYTGNSDATVEIRVAGRGFAVPDLDEDESYQLSVTERQARLTAPTVVGALRGLETLLQLQDADAAGLFLQGAEIKDAPRFRWRGLLLDVSRHFEPVEVIERTLDGMAMVKMNVFHWHLADDQGFRVESRKYPRLQELGSDSAFYTQDQIRDVVAYATDRGIRVIPEFDVPGHSSSWFPGYPELASGPPPYQIERTWGVFVPTMDPTKASTYRFLDGFVGEIGALFPDHYWHIGGDEVNPTAWRQDASIQEWMRKHHIANEAALQTAFNKRLFEILRQHGKTPVGWDEIFQPDLPTAAVIQSWRSSDALAASAKAGFHGILSAPYYIDHQKTTAEFYAADPLPANSDLTPEQQQLVLGGEACMWGEYITPQTVDSRIWPRLAAIAERFWSPASVNDVDDMYRRLAVTSRRLEELGLRHGDHTMRMARLVAGDSAALFESLLDFARPLDFGGSGPNQFYPHTRMIDAAVADPPATWDMAGLARRAIAGDATAIATLRSEFDRMAGFESRLVGLPVPAAAEAAPVARVLSQLGRVGNEALNFSRRKSAPDTAWIIRADSVLAAAQPRHPIGTLRPVGVDAVRLLVSAAEALPSPRRTP
ncbi:MAG: beta-N-acetylhexosaminidase [Gemmatimonadales bacterium]